MMILETRNHSSEEQVSMHERLRTELLQIKEEKSVTEKLITTPTGREIYIVVLDPEKAFSYLTAVVGEAHPDDAILGEGINIISSDIGVGVTYVTMTDGSARDDLDGFETPKDLALQRRQENMEAAKKAGAAMVINLGFPDSELQHNKKEATRELQVVLDLLKPKYMITPNRRDPHKDHAAGYLIAKRAKRGRGVSLYGTDTQTTKSIRGFRLRPTHYFEVSQEVKSRRDQEYESHISQVNVPNRSDVNEVFSLPVVRGAEKGWKYGGTLFKTKFNKDRLTPLLQQNDIAVIKQSMPRVLYEGVKQKFIKAA